MYRDKILILIGFILLSFSSISQTYWKIGNEYGDEVLLALNLNNDNKTFEAWSRKDALKDLAGIFTYSLAKAAGKLKYPEIVFMEGKTEQKKDTLFLTGTFNYLDRQYLFSASISGNHFDGKYTDTRNRSRPLKGIKVPDGKPIRDYASIINSAFSLIQKHLFDPLWLESDEWVGFKKKVNSLKYKISDDYELAATFFWLGKKLPFSPYEINKGRPSVKSTGRKNQAGIREINTNTAMFDGGTLPVNQKQMDSVATIIQKKGYRKLIIDLRGNNRLNPVSANIIADYLSNKACKTGVYLTRKWSDTNKTLPGVTDYQKLFKGFTEPGYQSGELYKEQGRILNIVPGEKLFKGKIYALSDSKTSKVAEALLYILKSEKIATVVGQKSAGNSLLSESLTINNEYDLNLPVSDFFTVEGKSLNKIGIEPDISKSGEEAMNYVLSVM
jgi:hypothetical protein